MKTKYITTKAVVVFLVSLVLVLISFNAGVGGLEPPGPPGSSESSMPGLDEIYAAASGTPPPQPAAYDMFLKIDGIPGECTDDKHKEWIEVLSYSHGVSQAGAIHGGGGGTILKAEHEEFLVVKEMDKATPKLNLFCGNGKHLGDVQLKLCRAADRERYMGYTLYDAIVSTVKLKSEPQTGEDRPTEEVSFVYSKIEWAYTEFDPNTGKPKGDVTAYWDLVANKGN